MSLVQTIQSFLTPRLLDALATKTGLPASTLRNGMGAASGSIVDGLLGRTNDPRAMTDIANLIDRTPDVDDPEQLLHDDSPIQKAGQRLLGFAVPDQGVFKRAAGALGIGGGGGATSMSSILGTVATLFMGAFRKVSRGRGGLDGPGLSQLLQHEAPGLRSMAPAATAASPVEAVETRRPIAHKRANRAWLLGLIPLALLGIWLYGRREPSVHGINFIPPRVVATRDVDRVPALPPGSAEAALMNRSWTVLDHVDFPAESAVLASTANRQISNVARVMKANPDAKLELRGHAGGTGTEPADARLAQDRAESVRQALINDGIAPARIDASTTEVASAAGHRVSARLVGATKAG